MFLSRVALNNVRSIGSMVLDFQLPDGSPRRWTLLLGENGCGKSSVLRAIALLLAGSEALPELIGNPDAWIRNGAGECRVDGTVSTAKGQTRDISLIIKRGDTIRKLFARNQSSLEALDAAIAHADRNYFVLGYGVSRRPSLTRRGPSFPDETARATRAQGVATMFMHDARLVSLEQWAMDLDYRKGQAALRSVQEALNSLLPEMKFARIDRQSREMIFRTVDGEVPLSQLSDGYQSMAAWCGDLLYRITETFPDRKSPLATRGVLLIDEIDLHLHPLWRRKLVEFLTRTLPNFQFVVTSHSALTAQQSGEGELYVIRREGAKNSPQLVPFVGEPRKMMLHQLLMSPMFGLTTLDSVEVERAKSIVRRLKTKKTPLTALEERELKNAHTDLRNAPSWDVMPVYAREQLQELRSIRRDLDTSSGSAPVSAEKLKQSLKSLRGRK